MAGLEVNLESEFEIPRITCAGNRPERCASKASVGIVERRRIRHVERLRAEFEIETLRNAKCLPDHQVRILETGSANRVSRTGPNYKLRRGREGCCVEVLRHAAPVKVVGVADSVGPLNRITQA